MLMRHVLKFPRVLVRKDLAIKATETAHSRVYLILGGGNLWGGFRASQSIYMHKGDVSTTSHEAFHAEHEEG